MNLKLQLVSVAAVLLIPGVSAVECGRWFSNACFAEEDIRYDEEASNTITDQAVVWGKIQGFFRARTTFFDADGDKIQPQPFNLLNGTGVPYPLTDFEDFLNLTFDGSRSYYHRYTILGPAPQGFCNQSFPVGNFQVVPPGICGENGHSAATETHSTSTYEKDGRITFVPFGGTATLSEAPLQRTGLISLPVDETTFYASFQDDSTFSSSTTVCLDPNCNQWTLLFEAYETVENMTTLSNSSRLVATRIPTAEQFVAEINESYERNMVPVESQVPAPMVGKCLTVTCPNETDWCTLDPNCSVSPYQEPNGSVKAGPIAGFVIAFFVVVIALLVLWYRRRMAIREARMRAKFARRIAETIQVVGSNRQLTPENLAAEFKKIDKDKGGSISKEELWDFISSGKAGELSESDFNALFASIDLDNNGTVDFMEFAAFFGKCSDDFEKVKNRQSVLMARSSFRTSVLEHQARRASMADVSASYLAGLGKVVEEKEDSDDHDEEADKGS